MKMALKFRKQMFPGVPSSLTSEFWEQGRIGNTKKSVFGQRMQLEIQH